MNSQFKLQLFAFLRRMTLALRHGAEKMHLLGLYKTCYEPLRKPVYAVLKPQGILQIEAQGMQWFVDGNDYVIASDLITYHAWEPEEAKLIAGFLEPGSVMIDVGSNLGYHALLAAKTVGKTGHIYAFEPEPHNFDLLTRNIRVNEFTNVTALPMILSDKSGKQRLYLSARNFGAHSLSEENVNFGRHGFVETESTTLDDFAAQRSLQRVALIKMDTQGAEGVILRGAESILKKYPDLKIIMEFWPAGLRRMETDPAEVLSKLKASGFKLSYLSQGMLLPLDNIPEAVSLAEKSNYLTLVCKR
jgi:FkbM family methyltransferase